MTFRRLALDALTLEDERSFRHVALYDALKQLLVRDGYRFRVPPAGAARPWDDALLLNLTFWDATEHGDVLTHDGLPADTVAHVAWHHAAARALPTAPSLRTRTDALFLAEAVASAFDLYLVGRLLGHAPDSDFLQTQVPAMVDVATGAGASEADCEALLGQIAAEPERAFEDLRALLFDAACALSQCAGVDAAAAALDALRSHRFGALLHHYALSNWVLYGRAYGDPAPDPAVRALDVALRRAGDGALALLENCWLAGSAARAQLATLGALGGEASLSLRAGERTTGVIARVDDDALELRAGEAATRVALGDVALDQCAFRDGAAGAWQPYRPRP